jgi:Tfp pilus assembly protein PilE
MPQLGNSTAPANTQSKPSDSLDELVRAFVGPKNQDYYMRHFSRFEGGGQTGMSWHWPAFFVMFYWLLYRKMWRNALIYFLLPYLVMIALGIVGAAAGESANTALGIGYLLYLVTIVFLPPLYANALYFNHCRTKIVQARASSTDLQRQIGQLSASGGTSGVVLVIIAVLVLISTIGILAAIAIPAYQDYTMRTRTYEALAFGKAAAESVAKYYGQHQVVPDTLADAGFAASRPLSVRAIGVDSQNGAVVITLAAGPIDGKELLLVPSTDASGRITWKCTSEDIPPKYLPAECRNQN